MKECDEWVKSYESQPHYVYGNTLHAYSYIADTYPNTINWDIDQILIVTMDIEVQCENGFLILEMHLNLYFQSQLKIIKTNALWFGVSVNLKIIVMMLHMLNVKMRNI